MKFDSVVFRRDRFRFILAVTLALVLVLKLSCSGGITLVTPRNGFSTDNARALRAYIEQTSASRKDDYILTFNEILHFRSAGEGLQQILRSAATKTHATPAAAEHRDVFVQLQSTVLDMQSSFFQVWLGSWPTTIDWTGAVMGTYISAVLCTLSKYYRGYIPDSRSSASALTDHHSHHKMRNNESPDALMDSINGYFAQTSAFYFGQNAFAIRMQAYDDMLWVVLGWLESIKFIDVHDRTTLLTQQYSALSEQSDGNLQDTFSSPVPSWHGKQFEAAFAHRARIFYDLVSSTWSSSSLCGGGLTWDPNKAVYKNTITNTLYISAAIGMYLYHPGDHNRSPFLASANPAALSSKSLPGSPSGDVYLEEATAHDPKYLRSAIEAYDWLKAVNLTNANGLYVDGYHVSDSSRRRNVTRRPSQCDLRTENVYTYNQGVILSGVRGLWEGTGNTTYLEDGHKLVRDVIRATGWNLSANSLMTFPSSSVTLKNTSSHLPTWHGLGRLGVLEEVCDAQGTCSQDAQTFKGIFFHHLTLFCEPLPTEAPLVPGRTFVADRDVAMLHRTSCKSYLAWVENNARAAIRSKDSNCRNLVGMWWTVALLDNKNSTFCFPSSSSSTFFDDDNNEDSTTITNSGLAPSLTFSQTAPPAGDKKRRIEADSAGSDDAKTCPRDANDRGRGRTVETQGSGVSVIRAWWELLQL